MLELFLYANLACQDADSIIIRISKNGDLPEIVRLELVETVKEFTPECYWDAND